MTLSTRKKNIDARVAIRKTMAVVTSNSRRDGQTIFETSVLTCCMNWRGDVPAMIPSNCDAKRVS